MGIYLSSPCREVDAEEGTGNNIQYAVGEMQGWRSHMEDAHIACLDLVTDTSLGQVYNASRVGRDGINQKDIALFGVFDGHGGKEVSLFVKEHYQQQLLLLNSFREGDIERALVESFHRIDVMLNDIEYDPFLKELKKRASPSDLVNRIQKNDSCIRNSSALGSGQSFPIVANSVNESKADNKLQNPSLPLEPTPTLQTRIIDESKTERVAEILPLQPGAVTESDSSPSEKDKKEEELERKYFDAVLRANTEDDTSSINVGGERGAILEGGVGRDLGFVEDMRRSGQLAKDHCDLGDFSDLAFSASSSTPAPTTTSSTAQLSESTASTAAVPKSSMVEGAAIISPANANASANAADANANANANVGSRLSLPAPLLTSISMSRLSSVSNPFSTDYRLKNDLDRGEGRVRAVSQESGTKYLKPLDDKISMDGNKMDLSTFSAAATAIKRSQLQALSRKSQTAAAYAAAAATAAIDKKKDTEELSQTEQNGEVIEGSASEVSGRIQPEGNICLVPSAPIVVSKLVSDTKDKNDKEILIDIPLRSVKGKPVSLLSNGIPICNLPDHRTTGGCTAIVALKVGMTLYVANAGDSRGVLCRGGLAHPLSEDHKPTQDRERARIEKSGGFVNHMGRINGNLNVSRSLGDLKYKQVEQIPPEEQMITAQPDITVTQLTAADQFIILGCDGIWDCLSCQEACDLVNSKLKAGLTLIQVVDEVLQVCLSQNPKVTAGIGGDNMTFLIVMINMKENNLLSQNNCVETTDFSSTTVDSLQPGSKTETTVPLSSNGLNGVQIVRKKSYKFTLSNPPE